MIERLGVSVIGICDVGGGQGEPRWWGESWGMVWWDGR